MQWIKVKNYTTKTQAITKKHFKNGQEVCFIMFMEEATLIDGIHFLSMHIKNVIYPLIFCSKWAILRSTLKKRIINFNIAVKGFTEKISSLSMRKNNLGKKKREIDDVKDDKPQRKRAKTMKFRKIKLWVMGRHAIRKTPVENPCRKTACDPVLIFSVVRCQTQFILWNDKTEYTTKQ